MKLRFGQIEEVLWIIHDVPKRDRTKFRGRLRNLKRAGLKLPSGDVGRRANFDPADMFKLAFVMELVLRGGMPPEPAATSVSAHWPDVAEQLFKARKAFKSGKPESRFLVAEPNAFNSKAYRFKPETGAHLGNRLAHPTQSFAVSTLLAVNIAAMLINVQRAAARVGIDMDALEASLDHHQEIVLNHGARVPLAGS